MTFSELFDRLYAVLLIVTVFIWAVLASNRAMDQFPNWFGVVCAIGTMVLGCHVVASVARDRLA